MAEICTGQYADPPEGVDWCVSFPHTPEFWGQGLLECGLLLLVMLLIGKGWKWIEQARRKVYVVPPTHSPYDQPSVVHRKRRRR